MNMDVVELGTLVVTGSACGWDLATRRIPNVLTVGAATVAVLVHSLSGGVTGGSWSVAGWLAGVTLFFPFFALRGMGAGDVKLLGAVGAWLGPADVVRAALFTGLAGGALALALVLIRGDAAKTFANLWCLAGYWRVVGVRPFPELTLERPGRARLPYALPIVVGAVVTLWLR